MARPPITTHVLDTTLGQPARRVPIELAYLNPKSNSWMILGSGSALVHAYGILAYACTATLEGKHSNITELTMEIHRPRSQATPVHSLVCVDNNTCTLLFCFRVLFIVDTNRRTENGIGLGMRLEIHNGIPITYCSSRIASLPALPPPPPPPPPPPLPPKLGWWPDTEATNPSVVAQHGPQYTCL